MRVRLAAGLLHFLMAPLLFAAGPRIVFERTMPASHDLGKAEELAVVHAAGEYAEEFLDAFLYQVHRSGALRVRDLRRGTGPAEAYLDIKSLTCETTVREGEGSTRDVDGGRVKRKQVWADALCTVRVDVLSRDMRRVSTFYAKGEGTSQRGLEVTDDERRHAIRQAARFAAVMAAERITPRKVRESVQLDESAPAFDEGKSMIDVSRLAEARAIWERALRTAPRSAALHFNLGAVCEALGDRAAAERHYKVARDLAPHEPRYANELKLFARRQ